jgi:nucleoside-diphosphate-sugar epimerase
MVGQPFDAVPGERVLWTLPRTIDRVYDAGRAREDLGWAPRFGFDEVLRQYDEESSEVLSPASGVREDE